MRTFISILFIALLSYGCDSSPVKHKPGTYVVKRRCNLVVAIEAGNHGFAHPWIKPKNIPVPVGCKEGEEVEVRIFSPKELGKEDGRIIISEAQAAMKAMDCHPVDWTLLLPLGEKYPELQLKFSILAIGKLYQLQDGRIVLPEIGSHKNVRNLQLCLSLNKPGGKWQYWSKFHFAATCK